MKPERDEAYMAEYDRMMLRHSVMSLIRAIITERRKRAPLTMQSLATWFKKDKAQVSRWFSAPPNWRLDTVADVAGALDVDIEVTARDRQTGQIITASGALPVQSAGASTDASLYMMRLPPVGGGSDADSAKPVVQVVEA